MFNCEMIGFQNKNHLQQQQNEPGSLLWKSFFNKQENTMYHVDVGPSSSSKAMNHEPSSAHEDQFYTHSMMVAEDDPSSLSVFPSIEVNERTSEKLSLSLNASNDPSSTMGFEFMRQQHHDDMRFDSFILSNKNSLNVQSQQHSMMQDGFLGKAAALDYYNVSGQQFQIRNSKYLVPVQELLNEFCNLGTEQTDLTSKIMKSTLELQDDDSKKNSPLFSLDLLELQRRKAKLIQMLEEVDRRYKHYCEQMKSVTAPFETVTGHNAAKVYSVLASKAMSRHFRCLRDGILEQIKITKKAMGEKDSVAPGTTRGETPRLRILDQTLRQQRAFQQMSIMETHPWRPQRGLPERSVCVLRAWLFEHFLHPYPSDVDKHILSRQTGLSRSQVSNWFINARVRLWKPMVEEMYLEELKEQQNNNLRESMDGQAAGTDLQLDDDNGNVNSSNKQNHQLLNNEDHKPTTDQLGRIDAEYLSSIINTNVDNNKNDGENGKSIILQQESHHQLHKNFSGAMEFDFSSFNDHHNSTNEIHFGDNENGHHNHQQNYGGGNGKGNRISLTLGLQQHGGSGCLAFSSASQQSSLFYSRDHIEDCQQVSQYSLLDNHESQKLPYRNLMGAQLLNDFAG
ncbi:homeodomain transcription factor [Lithospermum erythrorhizon]|uniref:Homeodomain transcription factor n=1 Tax=Lithospermum erythrorhizon TaxID=34254 RepID=A0AAV3QEM4_LITER